MKKITILLMLFVSVLSLRAEVKTGECGKDVTYTFDTKTGVLRISGSGAMWDYNRSHYYYSKTPWKEEYNSWGKEITSVIVEDGVTSIGCEAFYECWNITSVSIPNSVTRIGQWAFYSCGLKSLTIPSSVTDIGPRIISVIEELKYNAKNASWQEYTWDSSSAFRDYSSSFCESWVGKLIIGESVESIGNKIFKDCSIKEVYIKDLAQWCSISSMEEILSSQPALFVDNKEVNNLVIPESVTKIASDAFRGYTRLTSVTIPNSVTSIGSSAFYKCSGLTSVVIGNSVTSIGANAFYRCEGLTSLTIPNSVKSIGSSAFKGCSGLTSVTIPNSVTSIGGSAFADCYGLTSVTIPNSVTSIGESTFFLCESLTSVTIPNSVTSIGSSAFQRCYSLTSVTIPNSVTSIGGSAFAGCKSLTSVTIPNSVTSIGESTFENCKSLTSVTIPNSVISIGMRAFTDCSGLTSVTIPNSVTSIGNYAFSGCSGLTSVTIPNSVTSIGDYAFSGCSILTSVNIGTSVISVGNEAFQGCKSLTSVTVPNSVTSIGGSAFKGCSNLTSVAMGISVENIGASAFYGCKLETIVIPKSVNSIGKNAFNCPTLKAVHFKGFLPDNYDNLFSESVPNLLEMSLSDPVPPTLDNDFFKNTKYRSGTLYVPDKAVEAYSSTLPWYAWGEIRPLSELKLEGGPVDELTELKKLYLALQSSNEELTKDIETQKTAYAALQAKYDAASKELEAYKLGDLNKDGVTDIRDVETLIKLNSYSSEEMALSLLIEETGITINEIADLYGNAEFYTLDGKKVSKPSQSGVYIVKKDGQTKMVVVKK